GSITRIGAGDRPEVAVDDYDNGLAVWQSAIGISGNASKVYAQDLEVRPVRPGHPALSLLRWPRRPNGLQPVGTFSVIWQAELGAPTGFTRASVRDLGRDTYADEISGSAGQVSSARRGSVRARYHSLGVGVAAFA